MKKRWIHVVSYCLLGYSLLAQNFVDNDQDGMDDTWETENQLNPNDPNDAWSDADADEIFNLAEYYLASDPQNDEQPLKIPLPADGDLEAAIKAATAGSVILLTEGDYPISYTYVSSLNDGLNMMIQGGWNPDFTVRDLCSHSTNLVADNSLDLLDYIVEEDTINFIVDGLTIKQPEGVSNGIAINTENATANVVIKDCIMLESIYGGLGGALKYFIRGKSEVNSHIMNTLIANNTATAIDVSVSDTSNCHINILYTTIWNNADDESVISGGGLDLYSTDLANLSIAVVNSVLFDNEEFGIDAFESGESNLELTISNSIIDILSTLGEVDLVEGDQVINSDPLYSDPDVNDFTLIDISPAIGLGVNRGLGDVAGFVACGQMLSQTILLPPALDDLIMFPNPVNDYLNIRLNLNQAEQAKAYLMNTLGQRIKKIWDGDLSVGENRVVTNVADVPPGIYVINIEFSQGSVPYKVRIQ